MWSPKKILKLCSTLPQSHPNLWSLICSKHLPACNCAPIHYHLQNLGPKWNRGTIFAIRTKCSCSISPSSHAVVITSDRRQLHRFQFLNELALWYFNIGLLMTYGNGANINPSMFSAHDEQAFASKTLFYYSQISLLFRCVTTEWPFSLLGRAKKSGKASSHKRFVVGNFWGWPTLKKLVRKQ